ncbi:hypothetical conserved protein [Ectocarpus siliculosus]|uniref:Hypothetical conserved protein n=1 Tax=Ectocarpus siliculosus TaxID=2880 RepID=D8LS16_ECTSI|nr:hypothetical conserved protein [Ectocarpus siliculosus]|eukprot:CBN73800.1 hypothetical conserved protein [Ectocarpus siliculosus]
MLRTGAAAALVACGLSASLLSPACGFFLAPSSSFRGISRDAPTPPSSLQAQQRWTMGMEQIKVTKDPSEEEIKALGARSWPTWGCGVSKFPWTYEGTETCLILEGDVTVTPDDDRDAVEVGVGDLCVFPDGMSCTWDVRAPVKKHYKFE